MSELARFVVLVVAFVAFILAAYLQGGGTWHGPHSLRKSFHPNGRGGSAELIHNHRPKAAARFLESNRMTKT
jgi:hypothetical protein